MKLAFTQNSWADYLWFQEYEPKLLNRINECAKTFNATRLQDRQTRTIESQPIGLLVKTD